MDLLMWFRRKQSSYHDAPIEYKSRSKKDLKRTYTITCTTSPSRLKHLARNFVSMNPEHVYRIIVTIPERFRNDDIHGRYDPKDISKFQEDLQKQGFRTVIRRTPYDYGPCLKLLGALEIAADPEILVVIDDDVLYHQDLLAWYDEAYDVLDLQHSGSVRPYVLSPEPIRVFGIPVSPGYLSFSVRKRWIQMPQVYDSVMYYEKLHPRCLRHDDMTMGLSSVLIGLRHVSLQDLVNDISLKNPVYSLDVGFTSESLMYQGSTAVKSAWCAHAMYEDLFMCPLRPWTEDLSDRIIRWMFSK